MKNDILYFLAKNILAIHAGHSIFLKMWASAKIALAFSVPAWCIEKFTHWGVSNRDYIVSVMLCIAVDHLIGSYYHAFHLRDFTLKKNAQGLLAKLGMCAAGAILFEVIHNTVKDAPLVYEYLKMTTRLVVILYPAGSAFLNMSALTGGRFPPLGWIKKMKSFNENINLESLKQNNNGPDNPETH